MPTASRASAAACFPPDTRRARAFLLAMSALGVLCIAFSAVHWNQTDAITRGGLAAVAALVLAMPLGLKGETARSAERVAQRVSLLVPLPRNTGLAVVLALFSALLAVFAALLTARLIDICRRLAASLLAGIGAIAAVLHPRLATSLAAASATPLRS